MDTRHHFALKHWHLRVFGIDTMPAFMNCPVFQADDLSQFAQQQFIDLCFIKRTNVCIVLVRIAQQDVAIVEHRCHHMNSKTIELRRFVSDSSFQNGQRRASVERRVMSQG